MKRAPANRLMAIKKDQTQRWDIDLPNNPAGKPKPHLLDLPN
jgi:hypothetical protein